MVGLLNTYHGTVLAVTTKYSLYCTVVVNGKQMEQKPARAARAGLQGLGDPESAPVRRRKARYVGAFAWLLKLFCG